MINVCLERRELRSVYGVCNLIVYVRCILLFAVTIRVRTSFVYVCYGFVSIGYWGTKQQCVITPHAAVQCVSGALSLRCLYLWKTDTDSEPFIIICVNVLRVVCLNKSMEKKNRWHQFTFALIYFGVVISIAPSTAHKIQDRTREFVYVKCIENFIC